MNSQNEDAGAEVQQREEAGGGLPAQVQTAAAASDAKPEAGVVQEHAKIIVMMLLRLVMLAKARAKLSE